MALNQHFINQENAIKKNLKIILIKTPYLDIFQGGEENAFPLGIAYVAAILRNNNYLVRLIDPENQNMNFEQLTAFMTEEKPDIVGITCATVTFKKAKEIASMVKRVSNAKTVLGGIHTSSVPADALLKNCPEFDFITVGEAEFTFLELCDSLSTGKPTLNDIKGLAYREQDKIVLTGPRPFFRELDTLPFPARDLLPLHKYTVPKYIHSGKNAATMVSSRGCPAKCTFCAVNLVAGYEFRCHSAQRVVAEMEELVTKYRIKFIVFWDDTFTINKQRVLDICKLLIEKKLNVGWFCLSRVNTVDLEMLKAMKKAGCKAITYGVESGDQKILNNIKKGITLDDARKAFAWTKQTGIKCLGTFMFGNPGETSETMEKTINFAIELDPDIAHFYILSPLPGTELYNTHKGTLFDVSENYEDYTYGISSTDINLNIKSKKFTEKELLDILAEAERRFYFRPKYILKRIFQTRNFSELSLNFKNGLFLIKQITRLKNANN